MRYKKLAPLMLAVLLSVGLVGCNTSNPPKVDPKPTTKDKATDENMVRDAADEVKEDTKDAADKVKDGAKEIKDDAKDKVDEIVPDEPTDDMPDKSPDKNIDK